LRLKSPEARAWYADEAAREAWGVRALDRQIGTLFYERRLLSQDKAAVQQEARANIAAEAPADVRDFIRDPYVLEFLELQPGPHLHEAEIEQGLIDRLQQFLLELGKGFAFVARQKRLQVEGEDYFVDLVFYNYLLKCFVLIDLKTTELTHQDIGQMDMYVRMYDDLKRGEGDNPTVGILLCEDKDHSVVRYSVLNGSEQLFASRYKLILPSEEELRTELAREAEAIRLAMELGEQEASRGNEE
jgi:predicted nuclease of restriction endonuclease-like (RecB) superfamily